MPLLVEHRVPDATTCIVIGGLNGVSGIPWDRYGTVLWWTDAESTGTVPRELARERLQMARIEKATPSSIAAVIDAFARRDPRHLPSVFVTSAISSEHADDYRKVIEEHYRNLASIQQARITRHLDGFIWQKHILSNVGAYIRRRLPASWSGALRGLPAFVCGAGPSLDVSAARVAASADQAIVFCADSALRALARHGVCADFAISIDAAKLPEKCLPNERPPSRVVLSSVSPPSWQTALPPEAQFFVSSRQITDDWLATLGVPRTTVCATDNCGSTAIELAIGLGCDPIYLFGLDLAVDEAKQGQIHQQDADSSAYQGFNYNRNTSFPRVPGNYAETVPCFAFSHWEALDRRLAALTGPTVYNVTDRGARLSGTTLVHPDQCELPTHPIEKRARLGSLPMSSAIGGASNPAAATVFARLRAVGERSTRQLPAMREALAHGGPAQLAQVFRPILLDPDAGRALGAFSLKAMPHLIPPIEGKLKFWQSLLDEFSELAAIAQSIDAARQQPG